MNGSRDDDLAPETPDKKAADEYVVLPVDLEAGDSRRLGLVFDPTRKLKGWLLAEPGARTAPSIRKEES